MPIRAAQSSGVLAPPPGIFSVAFLLAMLLQWACPLSMRLAWWECVWIGVGLINLSGILALWAWYYMWRARTPLNPMKVTTTLVIAGPYHYSRNPLSVSLVVLYVGGAIRMNALWPVLLMPVLMIVYHWGVILREERYMEAKFGDDYRNYRRAVRRWV